MNMNMKNEKTMLALIVVAALAMVSVAGVALASESDAADTTQISIVGSQNIDTAIGNYQFYASSSLASEATVTIIIPEGNGYTGSIEFGTLFTGDYVTLNSVSFSDAGGMIVTIVVDGTTHEATISVAAINDAEVTGTATIEDGAFSFENYEGNLVVGDTTFTFKNVLGIVAMNVINSVPTITSGTLKADTTAAPVGWDSNDDYYASLTIDGTANISALTIGSADVDGYVETIITEGSDVSLPKVTTTQSIAGTNTFTMTTAGLVTGSAGVLVDKYGVSVGTVAVSNATTITVTITTGKTVYSAEEYYMVIGTLHDESPDVPQYSMGTVTFTEGTNKMTAAFSTSGIVSKMSSSATFTLSSANVTYTSSNYDIVYAADVKDDSVIAGVADGVATFGSAPVSNDSLFFILSDKVTGKLSYCYGTVTINGTGTATVLSSGNVSQVGTYTGVEATSIDASSSQSVLTVSSNAKVTVIGTLSAVATNTSTTCGKIVNDGAITVTGLLTLDGGATGIVSAAGTINAAYYSATVTTTSVTTNYYTTITKALAASNTVTTVGTNTILEDMTIAGADTTKNTTFTVKGTLNIGKTADSAVVTVPVTAIDGIKTTLAFSSGTIYVNNGQLVLTGVTADVNPYKANIVSDVFISTSGSYTDLATATTIVTSGEIVIRKNIEVSSKIDIVSGVTLDAKAFTIEVKAGGELIINGTLKSTTSLLVDEKSTTKAAGILTFNTSNVTFTALTMNGVFNVGKDATLTIAGITQTVDGDVITTKIAPTINVDGTLNLTGSIGKVGTYVNVTGILNIKNGTTLEGTIYFTVSGTLNNAVAETIDKLTLTGTFNATATTTVTTLNATAGTVYADEAELSIGTLTATSASSIDHSENGVVTIVTSMTVGSAPKTFGNATNSANVDVILGASATATVYGTYSADNMVINKSTTSGDTAYNTAYYLQANENGTNVLYATFFAAVSTVSVNDHIAISAMTGYNAIEATNAVWYDADNVKVEDTDHIGSEGFEKVYGYITGISVSVTFSYVEGVTYVVDGISIQPGVSHNLHFGEEHRLSIKVNNGYTGTPEISVEGISFDASTGMFYVSTIDSARINVTGVEVKEDPVEKNYNDLVTILLVIITIVIIIMAVIIALKLLRS